MTTDTVGGVWTHALDLARALQPYDISITMATMGAPLTAAQQSEAAAIVNLTVYGSVYKLEWMPDPWDDQREAGQWLLELEAAVKPDIVHLTGYAQGHLPFQAPILLAGHSCVCSWMRAVRGEEAGPEWNRYREEARRGLAQADMVIAPTQAMLDALNSHYGPLQNCRVIPNGRDGRQFHSGQSSGQKEPLILTAGRVWDEAKNTAALDGIAGQIAWPIFTAGEARHPAGGETELNGLRMLGCLPPEELVVWFRRAAIYALPARYEPFGLSALEAALSGCALILGDIPSLREVWGAAALFVPPDDASALRNALETLIENDALRTELAERALRRAQYFTLERMGAGYLGAYQALLPLTGC